MPTQISEATYAPVELMFFLYILAELEKTNGSIDSKKTERQSYQDDLNCRTSELQALEVNIETAFKERKDLRETHAANEKKLGKLQSQMKDLQNKLDVLNSKVDENQEHYNKVEKDAAERQREIDHFNARQVKIDC